MQHCQFRPNWDNIPSEALQIFGHREAEQEAVKRQLERVQQDNRVDRIVINSVDQYTLDGGHLWVPVTQARIVKKMNHKLQAPESITLFVGAIMRFTCNDNSGRRAFHQSQLCVVRSMPVDEGAFTVRIAPPGRRNIPRNEQEFVDEGWHELTISKTFTIPQRLEGAMMVRREQYPIRHYIAATIHKVMGDTLGMVATQISDKKSAYKLWLKSQLYVIISRVREMRHIYFVGAVNDTMMAIRNLLRQYTQWEGYVRHVVGILTSGDVPVLPPIINFNMRPFRSRDTPIPPDQAGYVYIIVSTRNTNISYIGQTINLRHRLNQHNSGSPAGGARFTSRAHFQPWGLLGYIVGFDYFLDEGQNRNNREHVEHTWDHVSRNRHNGNPTPLQILDTWLYVFDNVLRQQFPNLVLVQCADI